MELKNIFNRWAAKTAKRYSDRQWLLSKWEVLEGVSWPQEKIYLMLKTIKEELKLSRSASLIDLGCGGGWVLRSLRPSVRKAYGADLSLEMLKVARRLEGRGKFTCGEMEQLPFRSKSFSRVLSYFVFINLDETYAKDSLLEIHRILKKGGRALIGQIPDKQGSKAYDAAKKDYLKYCARVFKLGRDTSRVHAPPIRLFDRAKLSRFLDSHKIPHEFAPSFNPFWRCGEPLRVNWRFDLILKKARAIKNAV